MKPMLKPPETKRLKLKYGEPLSEFTFKINLRRYTREVDEDDDDAQTVSVPSMVGRCRLTVSKPVLKAPMVSALDPII
jgi:hypothetical protein